ncbi:MAG: c-type cytochrome [Trueperaceae bacterium]
MVRLTSLVVAVLVLGFVTGLAQEEAPPEGPPTGPPPVLMLEGDAENGATIVNQICSSCHGESGNSPTAAFPRLAGQIEDYLAIQTWLFKIGARPSPIMAPVASALSDQEIVDAAAYLAAETPSGQPFPDQDAAAVERGATVFHQGNVETDVIACAICHGRNGEGVAATGIPRIAGQSPTYLTQILNEFAMVPDFGNPFPNAMHIVASALTEEDMNAVVAYLANQPWGSSE